MHPILFQFGPVKIYSYGLLVALAFIVGTYLGKIQAAKEGITAEKLVDLSLILVISGILGARLFYVLQNLDFYLEYPQQILMLHKGGLSFYGGFIAAIICAVVFLHRVHLSVLQTFDLMAPYLALAQAVGRIGCFLNGCCYGIPTDSAFRMYFPAEEVGRHPVQIYSSLALVLIFIVLRIAQTRKTGSGYFLGRTFLLYCLLYSSLRFLIEYLRGDSLKLFLNLTIHQLLSLVILVVSVGLLYRPWKDSNLRSKTKIEI